MNRQSFLFLIFCVVLTLVGAAAGWYASNQRGAGVQAPPDVAPVDTGARAVHLSPQTLENLGVTVAPARLENFSRHREIPAVVTETPATYQPVFAPVGGRIETIRAEFGSVVRGKEVMVTLIRDALPRPQLTLTEEALKPATEEFHEIIGEMRTSVRSLEIQNQELKRLEQFGNEAEEGDLPIIPAKDLIELRYDISRTEQDLANRRTELKLHGLSEDEIARIESGGEAEISLEFWHNALIRNGLWPSLAEEIYNALPEESRDLPWTVATIAELVAMDLADKSLLEWFKNEPRAGQHFITIGGLLQAGSSLAEVKSLCNLGALDEVVEIRAPSTAMDWDVKELFIKPGEHVEVGTQLLTLADPRNMYLRVESLGSETADLLLALERDDELDARTLVPGTGPPLVGLRILNLVNEEETEGTVAYLPLENEPLKTVSGKTGKLFRSWKVRDGLRYMLRIPIDSERMEGVFVVPADAVTDDGPDKVVFIQDADAFKPQKVVLLYIDEEHAVLGKNSELFEGDMVVQNGAFGLGLALNAGGGDAVDEHAGHNH